MPSFRYIAIDPAGQTVRGLMDAATEAEVVAQLQRAGSIPMRAEPARRGPFALLHREVARRGMSRGDVAEVTRELAVMLGAGQDLDHALRFVVETAGSARLRRVAQKVRDAVRDGSPLAAALAQQPRSFPPLFVGLVRAGEAGGTLAATLDSLATLLERQRSLEASVRSALIYPALLLAASVGSVALLLTHVLPQFVPLFEQNGAALPGPTRALMAAGDEIGRAHV